MKTENFSAVKMDSYKIKDFDINKHLYSSFQNSSVIKQYTYDV